MQFLSLNISSKNKKSLKIFLKLFKIFFFKKRTKTRFQAKKIKTITLLRSPHVHKTAQEHFESRIYRTLILMCLFNTQKFLLLFKQFLKFCFYDLKLTIHFFSKKTFKSGFLDLRLINLNFHNYFFINFVKKKTRTFRFFKLLNFNGKLFKKVV